MEYGDIVREVARLDFIGNEETAGEAVAVVLRLLTSRLGEPAARKITERLPAQLSYDVLHAKSGPAVLISLDEVVTKTATHFKLGLGQSARLVWTVLDTVKRAIGKEGAEEMERNLPPDWVTMLREGPAPFWRKTPV